ncbi:MAG: DinB family protein [Planctomycetota bacterium]
MAARPKLDPLAREVVAAWKRHQKHLVFLLTKIPEKQLAAVPLSSKGRDVARQFAHMNRTRLGWLHFHATGQKPELPKSGAGERPKKAELKKALAASGKAIEELLASSLRGEARVRLFGKSPVRWMTYLVEHEAHHRGSILLALKQSGFTLPEEVLAKGLWGDWIFGK